MLLVRNRRNNRLTWGYQLKRRYGIARSGGITYVPFYMTMFLEPTPLPEMLTYEIDLANGIVEEAVEEAAKEASYAWLVAFFKYSSASSTESPSAAAYSS